MSKPTLGGTLFLYNAKSQDYCYAEAIWCLHDLCDEVVVLDAGSTDGTREHLWQLKEQYPKMKLILSLDGEWAEQKGYQKLSYFTNKAIQHLTTDWNFNLQGDEIIDQKCFYDIREAIEDPFAEAYVVKRINLWKDPYHYLNVVQERKPCSTEIVRLARSRYQSFSDAESISAPASIEYLNNITIFHFGFVRDKRIHVQKIKHMQSEIFLTTPDAKLEGMEVFDPSKWFDDKDLLPITEELPVFIQDWAKERA